MEIDLVIADFELSYTGSFKTTSRIKYNVDFANSNVIEIENKLTQLHHNLANDINNNVNVGYDFNINDVVHIQQLLQKILSHYKAITGVDHVNSNTKLYPFLHQLKTDTKQLAKEVLKEVLNPTTAATKLTRNEKLRQRADQLSDAKKVNMIKKDNLNRNESPS